MADWIQTWALSSGTRVLRCGCEQNIDLVSEIEAFEDARAGIVEDAMVIQTARISVSRRLSGAIETMSTYLALEAAREEIEGLDRVFRGFAKQRDIVREGNRSLPHLLGERLIAGTIYMRVYEFPQPYGAFSPVSYESLLRMAADQNSDLFNARYISYACASCNNYVYAEDREASS